ncbi:RNA ligase 1 [Hyperolius riggenbachi]|uniref:RNA ligase 1 n=1 Tax=Hyperolius riggenbachi TaxID=752182 RepID=UPI0035A2CDE9
MAGAVQQKIPCVFLTEVKDEPSSKREHQTFKVVASETLNPLALNADIHNALPTEKIDGTCCYVASHKDTPYLWARFDRKPTKQADKRFKKHILLKRSPKDFIWNVDEDFRSVPEFWIPAKGVKHVDGKMVPDENGHIPGWVPVEHGNKQYCWHSSAVNYTLGTAIIMKPQSEDPETLEICLVQLLDLLEQTLELIGTNINGNPYGIGNKKNPIHLLVPHGTFLIKNLPALDHNSLISWFEHCQEGKVEGIVWHCRDGSLIKLHRHHLELCWPLKDTYLNSKPVSIRINLCKYEYEDTASNLLKQLSKMDSRKYASLKDIVLD